MIIDKLRLPLMVLGPLLLGAGTAGIAWATQAAKILAVDTAQRETREKVDRLEPTLQQSITNQAVLTEKLDALKEGIDRLENKMGTK